MKRRFAAFICAVIAMISVALPAMAQSDEFEAASIRRSATNIGPWSTQHPADGRFSGQNLSARRLILQAFNIEATEFQLTGGPGWIDSETYDINAKSDITGVISPARLQVLLMSLLTSRFITCCQSATRSSTEKKRFFAGKEYRQLLIYQRAWLTYARYLDDHL